jgi:enterochelin esterase family protein
MQHDLANLKRRKASRALFVGACLSLFLPAGLMPQQAPAGRGGRGGPAIVSPEVSSDRRATFRLYAPNARKVTVNGEWPKGNGIAMTKDDAGVWSVVTDPIAPEVYFYSFDVDGLTLSDPRNPRRNALFVPGPESAAYQVRDIPHGDLRQVWYSSPTMKTRRRMTVYTPPGYNRSKESYPVLYLLHGWGGDEEEWTSAGYTPQIMDSLLAENKIKPMIVVMPNGHPDEQAAPHVLPAPGRSTLPTAAVSEMHTRLSSQGMLDDVIPFVEANYRVKANRENRAIAGLSMGGEQATYIGLNHLDRFAWIGTFSGAFVMLPGRTAPAGQRDSSISVDALQQNFPELNAGANQKLHLLYFSCGTEDGLIKANRDMKDWLKSKEVRFVDVETPGYAHVWRYWRISLLDFAPRLFR